MDKILLSHGSGGYLTNELIEKYIVSNFYKPKNIQNHLDDSTIIHNIFFTSDSYTIKPLFFNGGDIGSLSVTGTLNDISVMGGTPIAISCSIILEEGFDLNLLQKITKKIGETSKKYKVPIITGDTKVVEKGSLEGILISTSGIGVESKYLKHNNSILKKYKRISNKYPSDTNLKPGDCIISSGTIGDHGISILLLRNNFNFKCKIKSDMASLNDLIESILKIGGITAMKDPTRGGISNVLHEWSKKSKVGIEINESSIPITKDVSIICDVLGLDPLNIANEGKVIIACIPQMAKQILNTLKKNKQGKNASILGFVNNSGLVIMNTKNNSKKIINPPIGDPIPRIC